MAGVTAAARRAMMHAAYEATRKAGEDLLGRAQREAPVETGRLRGSGHVEVEASGLERPRDGSHVDAVVSFDTPYAAAQHERTDYEHPKGGKAKFLEDPLKEQAKRYEHIVGEHVRRALASGGHGRASG